jgi:hypothetical protein
MPEVCLNTETVTLCPVCNVVPLRPRQKTCSPRCRNKKYRAPQQKKNLERRNLWAKHRHRDSHFTLGNLSVRTPHWLGPLRRFGKDGQPVKENQDGVRNQI